MAEPDDIASTSASNWRYVLVLSRFFTVFFETGICKSFGVLITELVDRYETNYTTMALICSIPASCAYLLGKKVVLYREGVTKKQSKSVIFV